MGSSHGTPFLGANEILDIDTLWEWNLLDAVLEKSGESTIYG
jgi:hypothetical protein